MLFLSSCLETLYIETEKKKNKSRLNTVRGCFCCELGLQGLNTCNRCIRIIVVGLESVLDFLRAQPLLCASLQLPLRAYLLPWPGPEVIMFQLPPLLLFHSIHVWGKKITQANLLLEEKEISHAKGKGNHFILQFRKCISLDKCFKSKLSNFLPM